MLMVDLEPVIFPPENVSIERIKQSIITSCGSKFRKGKPYRTVDVLLPTDFRLLPLFNVEEDRMREIDSYSMNTNKVLDCNWRKYVESLKTNNVIELAMPIMGAVANQLSSKPLHDIRMKLTFIPKLASNGLMNPSPTAPIPIKRKSTNNKNQSNGLSNDLCHR